MNYYINQKTVSICITAIFLILVCNSCYIYGQNNSSNATGQNKTLTLTNLQLAKLNSLLSNNINNTSGAINPPFGNVTEIITSLGIGFSPLSLLAVVAVSMVIPLVLDQIMAYRRNSKIKSPS